MPIFIHSNLSLIIATLFEQDISRAYASVRQEASEILHCAVIDIIIWVEFAEQVTKVQFVDDDWASPPTTFDHEGGLWNKKCF